MYAFMKSVAIEHQKLIHQYKARHCLRAELVDVGYDGLDAH